MSEPWNLTEAQRRQFREAHAEAKIAAMRDDFAKDIAAKARWALIHNDGWPKAAWSTGERLAVALVLDDPAAIEREDFTREQALSRLAGDVGFHITGTLRAASAADAEAWIEQVRAAL
ncbi:MAG TPA: hypothetical protein VGS62_06875 [Streptosporangiaceae bacterium]|nr:hypothetical protein [Streptosporangiaceae bacterium]